MATFVIDAMSVNAAFQNALSNNIVAEYPDLCSGVRFHIMDDAICFALRVIWIATGTSVKCYSSKPFPSFKVSVELSFSRIIHAHMLQKIVRDSCLAHHMHLLPSPAYSTDIHQLSSCEMSLVDVSLLIRVLQLQKTKIGCACRQYGILFHNQTFKNCLTPCHVV